MSSWIFDFGSNLGQNLEYFLLKSDKVVAVEANPRLNVQVREKFQRQILEGKLYVEECLITSSSLIENAGREQKFYVNRSDHRISSIHPPKFKDMHNWYQLVIYSRTVDEIIRNYMKVDDDLLYCKFDLEGFDKQAVQDMFVKGYFPKYVSLELNDPNGLDLLVASKHYNCFKLSFGSDIGKKIKTVNIYGSNGLQEFSFEVHSSGPVFDDLATSVFTLRGAKLVRKFKYRLGNWTDIHAARNDKKIYLRVEFVFVLSLFFKEIAQVIRRALIKHLPRRTTSLIRESIRRIKPT
jgi:hypothetical protein